MAQNYGSCFKISYTVNLISYILSITLTFSKNNDPTNFASFIALLDFLTNIIQIKISTKRFILNCSPSARPEEDWTFEDAIAAGVVDVAATTPTTKDLRAAWWKIDNADKMLALRVTRAKGNWNIYWDSLKNDDKTQSAIN